MYSLVTLRIKSDVIKCLVHNKFILNGVLMSSNRDSVEK